MKILSGGLTMFAGMMILMALTSRADGEGIPVIGGDKSRAQGPGHDRQAAAGFYFGAEFGLDADIGKDAVVGVVGQTGRQPMGAIGITLNAQGVITDANGGDIARARGGSTETARVEQLAADQAR